MAGARRSGVGALLLLAEVIRYVSTDQPFGEGTRAMVNARADILVTDQSDRPAAAVEVKNRQQLSPEVAAILRRNHSVHGYLPSTPYYLMLTQDVGYLWTKLDPTRLDAPPDYQFPLENVIQRYLKSAPMRRLSEAELVLVILQWLIELTLELQPATEEPERTLAATGFLSAIRGGRVIAEAAA